MGCKGPVFDPPVATAVTWSALGDIGSGHFNVLSMGFPHQAQVRSWPLSAASLLRL